MALFLVGENIDAKSAHLRARDGALTALVRGLYVDAQDDIDAMLRAHAVRIAHYLYPAAYLCAASAIRLGPSDDGRLFLAGRRNQRTRLRGLEIVQTQAPPRPSLDKAIVGDPLGEFAISISSPEQRMLEAFRLRSEQASALTEDMRRETADRLVAQYGAPEAVAGALWRLARANDWFREGEGAERYLRVGAARPAMPVINHAAFSLAIAWHGDILGKLANDGHEWRWTPHSLGDPPLIRETLPGTLPPFIEALLPEGWLAQVLAEPDQRTALREGKRYMSNITISDDVAEIAALPADVLDGRLFDFERDGLFLGTYAGPPGREFNQSFEHALARIFKTGTTPRLSGIQIKAPMLLDKDGLLRAATDLPFTHILKPAGTSGFEQMPVVEWLCLALGRSAGFTVPETALVEMPEGLPPALLVERFDIRADQGDRRRIALEDFCSILGVPAEDKYKGTIERMARALRPLSTNPVEDIATLYARAVFAWMIADGDMHLKNLAMLRIAEPGSARFDSVRMAPLYDALTTRVFPGLAHDHMALKLSGKDDRLDWGAFQTLARTIDLPLGKARDIVTTLIIALTEAVGHLKLPALIRDNAAALTTAEQVIEIVRARADGLEADLRAG